MVSIFLLQQSGRGQIWNNQNVRNLFVLFKGSKEGGSGPGEGAIEISGFGPHPTLLGPTEASLGSLQLPDDLSSAILIDRDLNNSTETTAGGGRSSGT